MSAQLTVWLHHTVVVIIVFHTIFILSFIALTMI